MRSCRFVWALPLIRDDLRARQDENLARVEHDSPEMYRSAPAPFRGNFTQVGLQSLTPVLVLQTSGSTLVQERARQPSNASNEFAQCLQYHASSVIFCRWLKT